MTQYWSGIQRSSPVLRGDSRTENWLNTVKSSCESRGFLLFIFGSLEINYYLCIKLNQIPMKIYRYEIETIFGPTGAYTVYNSHPTKPISDNDTYYRYNELRYRMGRSHDDDNHPGARYDFDRFDDDYFCACLSLDELKQWFKGFNAPLKRFGFKIMEYEVSTYRLGKSRKQCFFKLGWVKDRKVIE